ncbi:MAG: OmpA family protein [Polyangia bacterium]
MLYIGKHRSPLAIGGLLTTALVISGCCSEQEKRIAELTELNESISSQNETLREQVSALEKLEGELDSARAELRGLRLQVERSREAADLAARRQETLQGLLDSLEKMIEAGDLQVRIRRGRMVIALPSAVLFESGEASLSDKGRETLKSVAEVFGGIKDRDFQVAGHTDNVPLSEENPHESNWHLSAARAVEVVQFLIEHGVPGRRLSAAGYAHHQPVAPNRKKRGKARNRRIEITLMPNLEELPDLSKLEAQFQLVDPPPDSY